jgi:hypothetical protein
VVCVREARKYVIEVAPVTASRQMEKISQRKESAQERSLFAIESNLLANTRKLNAGLPGLEFI